MRKNSRQRHEQQFFAQKVSPRRSLPKISTLSCYYTEAKGLELREAFANTLCSMIVPWIDLATAEVNLPKWERIFSNMLLPRVIESCEKQKYRAVTLELAVTVLCLCNKKLFLEKWVGLAEAIATLLKVWTKLQIFDSFRMNKFLAIT